MQTPFKVQIEKSLFVAAVGSSGCRLVNNIIQAGLDDKCRRFVEIAYNQGPVDKKGIGAESGGFQLRFSTYARSKG